MSNDKMLFFRCDDKTKEQIQYYCEYHGLKIADFCRKAVKKYYIEKIFEENNRNWWDLMK